MKTTVIVRYRTKAKNFFGSKCRFNVFHQTETGHCYKDVSRDFTKLSALIADYVVPLFISTR